MSSRDCHRKETRPWDERPDAKGSSGRHATAIARRRDRDERPDAKGSSGRHATAIARRLAPGTSDRTRPYPIHQSEITPVSPEPLHATHGGSQGHAPAARTESAMTAAAGSQ
jgi:hypothetical protein